MPEILQVPEEWEKPEILPIPDAKEVAEKALARRETRFPAKEASVPVDSSWVPESSVG